MIDCTNVKVGDKFRARNKTVHTVTNEFSEKGFFAEDNASKNSHFFLKNDGTYPANPAFDLIEKIEEPSLINPDDIVFGRELVMRSGDKAIVHAKHEDELFGLYFDKELKQVHAIKWKSCGRTFFLPDHPCDLVGIWQEPIDIDWSKMPAWVDYIAMSKNGKWDGFWNGKPTIHCCDFWVPNLLDGACTRIHPDYAPKWKGDWTKSLVKRPDNAT